MYLNCNKKYNFKRILYRNFALLILTFFFILISINFLNSLQIKLFYMLVFFLTMSLFNYFLFNNNINLFYKNKLVNFFKAKKHSIFLIK